MSKIEKAKLDGYRWKCNKCGKVIVTLSKKQLSTLVDIHTKAKHGEVK